MVWATNTWAVGLARRCRRRFDPRSRSFSLSSMNISLPRPTTTFARLALSQAISQLRQDPLEAILVIFDRRFLDFFVLFERSWQNMKNDTTFVRMRSGDHLGDANMSKRAPRFVEFNYLTFFTNRNRRKRFSQNERRMAYLQNIASNFIIFALGLGYDLTKCRVMILPRFFDFERP